MAVFSSPPKKTGDQRSEAKTTAQVSLCLHKRRPQKAPQGEHVMITSLQIILLAHCHEIEHRRKVRIKLVDCLTRRSFSEGGEYPRAPDLSRRAETSE
jgi:hypothetical protein